MLGVSLRRPTYARQLTHNARPEDRFVVCPASQCNAEQDNWFLLLIPENGLEPEVFQAEDQGTLLHYEASGPDDAECVLLLHGWGSSAEYMRPIARMLDDRYHVVNVDLPGHGKTPAPKAAIGVEECAELVAMTARSVVRPPVTLFGHSNGGRIALFMASDDRYAGLVKRLILISPSGIRPRRRLKVRLKSMLASVLKFPFRFLPRPYREQGLDWLRESSIWRMLGSSDYRALSGVMRASFVKTVNYFIEDRLSRISVPTLIFWGDQDRDVGMSQIQTIASRIPDAGVVTLKGAGHYGYLDDPATVSAATKHFLSNDQDDGPPSGSTSQEI